MTSNTSSGVAAGGWGSELVGVANRRGFQNPQHALVEGKKGDYITWNAPRQFVMSII